MMLNKTILPIAVQNQFPTILKQMELAAFLICKIRAQILTFVCEFLLCLFMIYNV